MTKKEFQMYYDSPTDFRPNDEGQRFYDKLNEVVTPLIKSEIDAGFNPDAIMSMKVSAASADCTYHRIKLWSENNKYQTSSASK